MVYNVRATVSEGGGREEGVGGLSSFIAVVYWLCSDPSQAINNEEELLEWEMTPFPQIQMISQLSEPYHRLWKTAINFHEKRERWMNGEDIIHAVTSNALQ